MNVVQPSQDAVLRLAAGGMCSGLQEVQACFQQAWPILERFVLRRLAANRLPARMCADCGQVVFSRIWRFRANYRGGTEGEFWAWIRAICDNESRRMLTLSPKTAEADSLTESSKDSPSDANPGPEDRAASQEQFAALRVCLGKLPLSLSSVVEILYFPPTLSERAAAEIIGISPAAIHKRKMEALRRLASCLEEKGFTSERNFERRV